MRRSSRLDSLRTAGCIVSLAAMCAGLSGASCSAQNDLNNQGAEGAALAAGVSIWDSTSKPLLVADVDTAAVEIGTKFTSDVTGTVSAVRFYKASTNTGTHTGHLWSRTGALLGSVAFTGETAAGWQTGTLAAPVRIQAGTTYVVSYHTNVGHYSADQNYFAAQATDHAPLHALKNGTDGANGVYHYGASAFPTSTYRSTNYWVDVIFNADTTSADAGAPGPSVPPATDAGATAPAPDSGPTPTPTPTTGWPDATNTGVRPGVVLTDYAGPFTITTPGTVLSGKRINGDLIIRAPNVVVTDCVINGRLVSTLETGTSVTVSDSQINGGNQEMFPSVGYNNITLRRVEVTGGQHSVQCTLNCTVEDSWLHGQYLPSTSVGHVNAFISNGGSGFVLRHNTLHCTAIPMQASGGCTADASLFGDFGPISNATMDGNLFKSAGGYCLHAGYNPSKPYGSNPSGVVITNNVFARGTNNKCGIYGPVTSFLTTGPGNRWTGNVWDNGGTVNP